MPRTAQINASMTPQEQAQIKARADALHMSVSRLMVVGALAYEPDADSFERLEGLERRLAALEELAGQSSPSWPLR